MNDCFSEKLNEFEEKLKNNHDDGNLWFEFGLFLLEKSDSPQKALTAFQNAEKLLPNEDFSFWIAECHKINNNLIQAQTAIEKAIKKKASVQNFCVLADILILMKKYKEAELACDKAIAIDNTFEEAYYLKGDTIRCYNSADSIYYFKKALELDSNYQLAWQALGRELIKNRKTIQDGIKALKKAVTLDKNDCWALVYLANAFWQIGDMNMADSYYRKAILASDNEIFQKFYEDFKMKKA